MALETRLRIAWRTRNESAKPDAKTVWRVGGSCQTAQMEDLQSAADGGDVDPIDAATGISFVIHQHYATRLHHDLRLEMLDGSTPVLVSWAVPKGVPHATDRKVLAVRTPDHSIDYGSFSGTIPEDSYGAGEVRIFDSGTYEMVKRGNDKIEFRLEGQRLEGAYRMIRTGIEAGRESWLLLMTEDGRAPAEPQPSLSPMLAILEEEAFDDAAWQFEPKWDGVRALAVCEDDETRLYSRVGNNITAGYPELHELHRRVVGVNCILDGEVVAFEDGVPSFQKLQQRMHVRSRGQVERLMRTVPVVFMAFDIIYLDGRDLTPRTLQERRRVLEEVVVPNEQTQISPALPGDGIALFEAAKQQGLEGIVAKRITSSYRIGARSHDWLKVKAVFDLDAVVVGWTKGTGSRSDTFGSLVMALYDAEQLSYIGNVGTGFAHGVLKDLHARLEGLGEAPAPFPPPVIRSRPELRHAHWVPPEMVAVVEYRQVTQGGRLRAPSFIRLRDDKLPRECTVDQLVAQ